MTEFNGEFKKLWTIERKESSPWYWGYLFQGCVVLGLLPILLPIIVAKFQGPANVGLVVALFYVGQVISPVFGNLADKTKRYGLFFLGSFAILAIGLLGFVLSRTTSLWCIFAFLQGAGAGIANTVSYSFIVEFKPESEWDGRLGWLQTFYGTGQAIGLMLAAAIQSHASFSLYFCAALMLPGIILGRIGLPKAKKESSTRSEAKEHDVPAMSHARTPATLLRHYEHLGLKEINGLKSEWLSFFGLFVASWFFLMLGTWMIYNLYPLLMKQAYDIPAGLSSLYYGVAATIGVFFYAPSGSWAGRFGSAKIVLVGVLMTLFSILGMALLLFAGATIQKWLVPPVFIVLPVAWSPMIVAGTALAGKLAKGSQGTAMGLFNATTAVGSVVAALLAGSVAQWLDYGATCWVAAGVTVVGMLLFLPITVKKQ